MVISFIKLDGTGQRSELNLNVYLEAEEVQARFLLERRVQDVQTFPQRRVLATLKGKLMK